MLRDSLPFQRLFVTGALGAVATLILPELRQSIGLSLSDIEEGEVQGVPVQSCDLLDFPALLQGMRGCDTVLHLAIASGRRFPVRTAPDDEIVPFDAATLDVNTRGVYHLFEAALRAGVRRVLLMSSLTLFQGYPTARERSLPDLTPLPTKLYAVTKLFSEEIGALYHRKHGMEVLILRLGQPYPLGTEHDRATLATAEGRQLAAHRDDIAAGVLAALKATVPYGIFNLVSRGDPYSFDLCRNEPLGYTPAYTFYPEGPRREAKE